MNTRSCCKSAAEWVAPGVGLVLIPKCPACVAAYVAAMSGIGISMPMAATIRWGLIILCLLALAFAAVRQGLAMRATEHKR
jgi:hypothetical protein